MPSCFPVSSLTNTDDVVRFSLRYSMLLLDKINMDATISWFAFSVLFAITSCSTIVLPLLSKKKRKRKIRCFDILDKTTLFLIQTTRKCCEFNYFFNIMQ